LTIFERTHEPQSHPAEARVLDYFRRDFHLLDNDTTPLAQAYFAEHPVVTG